MDNLFDRTETFPDLEDRRNWIYNLFSSDIMTINRKTRIMDIPIIVLIFWIILKFH